MQYYSKKVGPFSTSNKELKDLFWAWIVISLAFTILLSGDQVSIIVIFYFLASAFTVGAGFLLHELAHKVVAQHYGCFAEFRASPRMLLVSLLSATMGFIFAAPGAVMISGYVDDRKSGIISVVGPVTNLILAVLFIMTSPILGGIANYGAMINGWLAFFNMIPIGVLDGAKVLRWNRAVFAVVMTLALVFAFIL